MKYFKVMVWALLFMNASVDFYAGENDSRVKEGGLSPITHEAPVNSVPEAQRAAMTSNVGKLELGNTHKSSEVNTTVKPAESKPGSFTLGVTKIWNRVSNGYLTQDGVNRALLSKASQGKDVSRELAAGADVNAVDTYTPSSIKNTLTPIFQDLGVNNTVDALTTTTGNNNNGDTALHKAVQSGNVKVVQQLLNAGAKVNATNSYSGATPLHDAAQGGNQEMVNALLDKGAQINTKDRVAGNTPLHYAVGRASDNSEVTRSLLAHGADVTIKNTSGQTPLDITGNFQSKNVLKTAGASNAIKTNDVQKS